MNTCIYSFRLIWVEDDFNMLNTCTEHCWHKHNQLVSSTWLYLTRKMNRCHSFTFCNHMWLYSYSSLFFYRLNDPILSNNWNSTFDCFYVFTGLCFFFACTQQVSDLEDMWICLCGNVTLFVTFSATLPPLAWITEIRSCRGIEKLLPNTANAIPLKMSVCLWLVGVVTETGYHWQMVCVPVATASNFSVIAFAVRFFGCDTSGAPFETKLLIGEITFRLVGFWGSFLTGESNAESKSGSNSAQFVLLKLT